MPWNLDSNLPIYPQIMERITMDIISGTYLPGSKLPSVRDLAQDAGVNPNTMQKALSELERTGLLYSQRTSGRFITEDLTMIEQTKNTIASEQVKEFLDRVLASDLCRSEGPAFYGCLRSEQEEAVYAWYVWSRR